MQILGIVQLGIYVRSRLFLFIFGGEDGVLQPYEKALKSVWNAMLMRKIWQENSIPRFCAILLSFDDMDFQRLALNDRDHHSPGSSDASEAESSDDFPVRP